jgi:hypothetical protein
MWGFFIEEKTMEKVVMKKKVWILRYNGFKKLEWEEK